MFSEITQSILEAIKTHGIIAVVIGVGIETILAPIPSPLILMFAGYILISSKSVVPAFGHALYISVVAGIAQTIGSYLLYYIGYFGGKPFIEKFDEILTFKKKFDKNKREDITLGILRALPIMPLSVVSGVAGIIKMDFKRFTIATFIGVIPRNVFLALLGWQLKGAYERFAGYIDNIETVMTLLIIFIIVAYILAKRFGIIDKIRKKVLS